ncbi:hypothetical protein BYT27DRAFT_7184287 [Phlegmacium glaucopus]|nr:hypothetical protein BYT27DRAFT_7184287 [Phlegmacium glaucopus]
MYLYFLTRQLEGFIQQTAPALLKGAVLLVLIFSHPKALFHAIIFYRPLVKM